MKKHILASGNQELLSKFENWQALQNRIARVHYLSPTETNKKDLDINQLKKEANELEKQLSAMFAEFKQVFTSPPTTYQDLQKHLNPDEVAVEIIRTDFINQETNNLDTAYLALILTQRDIIPVLMKNGGKLEEKHLI